MQGKLKRKPSPLLLKVAYYSFLGLSGLWLIGFFIFLQDIVSPAPLPPEKTDLIIVLTGGKERVKTGLELLKENQGKSLLISGVYPHSSLKGLLSVYSLPLSSTDSRIILGKEAANTWGNAVEATYWITKTKAKSIRLITGNYHMPRSLMLFKKAFPRLKIITHPVHPEPEAKKNWIKWPGILGLLFLEYNKYLLCLLSIGGGSCVP